MSYFKRQCKFFLRMLHQCILNRFVSYIPVNFVRKFFLRLSLMKLSSKCQIDMGCYYMSPWNISVGNNSHINQGCILDGRIGGIIIGDNVSISHRCMLMTASHDINSENFQAKGGKIIIDDYVFIGVGATILDCIKIGRGAVVCAGAVVTKDVPEFSVVAGVPAKIISVRTHELNYECHPDRLFS